MKFTYIFIFFGLLFTHSSQAQSEAVLYGVYNEIGESNSFMQIAAIDPLTADVLNIDTIPDYPWIALTSSTFDQLEGRYRYLATGSTTPLTWLEYSIFTGELTSEAVSQGTLNGLEYDMFSGNTYAMGLYLVDSANTGGPPNNYGSAFTRLDFETGDTEILSLQPEISAFVAGATMIDPIARRYYLIGVTQNGSDQLISIDIDSGDLVSIIDLGLANNEFVNELHLDVMGQIAYAIHRDNIGNMQLATIDLNSGAITDLLDISDEVPAFTPNGSAFHQETGQFIIMGYDGGASSLVVIDTQMQMVIAETPMTYSFIELQVDNVDFAQLNFVGLEESTQPSFTIYPNPAQDFLVLDIEDAKGDQQFLISDATGRAVQRGALVMQDRIDISQLLTGTYQLTILGDQGMSTQSFQVK